MHLIKKKEVGKYLSNMEEDKKTREVIKKSPLIIERTLKELDDWFEPKKKLPEEIDELNKESRDWLDVICEQKKYKIQKPKKQSLRKEIKEMFDGLIQYDKYGL